MVVHECGPPDDSAVLPCGAKCDITSCGDIMSEKSVMSKFVPDCYLGKGMSIVGNLMLSIDGVLVASSVSEVYVVVCGRKVKVPSMYVCIVVADPIVGEGSSTVFVTVALDSSCDSGSMS